MSETVKGGCYLFNRDNGCIALIYRDYRDDYSFPKGHLDEGETIEECAIRETAEEVKRVARILSDIPPTVERYTTPSGEKCVCYMYVAEDMGHSDNDSWDTHDLIWVPVDEVEEHLTYEGLKFHWRAVKDTIKDLLKSN